MVKCHFTITVLLLTVLSSGLSHMMCTQLISGPTKKGKARQKCHYTTRYTLGCVRSLPKLTQILIKSFDHFQPYLGMQMKLDMFPGGCSSGFVAPFSSICRGEGSEGGLKQG